MVLTEGEAAPVSAAQHVEDTSGANRTLIEAILRGDEPDGLSLKKLRKNLPVRWDEQRKAHEQTGAS